MMKKTLNIILGMLLYSGVTFSAFSATNEQKVSFKSDQQDSLVLVADVSNMIGMENDHNNYRRSYNKNNYNYNYERDHSNCIDEDGEYDDDCYQSRRPSGLERKLMRYGKADSNGRYYEDRGRYYGNDNDSHRYYYDKKKYKQDKKVEDLRRDYQKDERKLNEKKDKVVNKYEDKIRKNDEEYQEKIRKYSYDY